MQTAYTVNTAQKSALPEGFMTAQKRLKQVKLRGHHANTQWPETLAGVVRETAWLWRKHHFDYEQTKYVVEQARHHLSLAAAAHAPAHGGAAGESRGRAPHPGQLPSTQQVRIDDQDVVLDRGPRR
jgi:hypothetical protein